jgi:hypothetical protein
MSKVIKSIKSLKVKESISILYNDSSFILKAYSGYKEKINYSIWKMSGIQGMNVDKITNKYITLYDFNMMGQKSSYKMEISKISII